MPAVPPAFPSVSLSADNMRRLIALRGITLFVALAMALLAEQVFRIRVDIDALLIICGVWAMFCAATWWRMTRTPAVGQRELLAHLVTDLVLLTIFLAFSGGTANPLTALYLMPVAAAAALLHRAAASFIAVSAIAAYALLWIFAVPIVVEDVDAAMQMHLAGMWLTFGLSAVLMVGIVARMGAALRARERQLAAARADSLRSERIAALGSLAAGAAHQLGTPLNTALLLADEIAAQMPDSATATDAIELRAQIERCRDIVQGLLSEAKAEQEAAAAPMSAWLSRVVEALRHRRGDCVPALRLDGGIGDRVLRPDATVTQSLADLLDNAAAVSPGDVVLSCALDHDDVVFRVRDAGPGFSAEALAHIGREPWSDKPGGMGFGLYLACATAERLGGTLECRNLERGAEVVLRIPAATLDLR